MKGMPLLWIARRVKRRIPMILAMAAAQVGHAFLAVLFALGSRGVIDSAVSGERSAFVRACVMQAGIILATLLLMAVVRHLREKLRADLERDWKKQLLHGILHGEYAQVSRYHSAELINRLNNDVSRINDGILSVIPGAAALVTRLLAAVVVLGALDARFTAVLAALGCGAVAATGLMRRCLKELNKRVSECDGRVSGFLQEMMEKLLMVQAMDAAQEAERRADELLDERYAVQRKRKNASVLTHTGVSVMTYGAGFLALVWCAARMLQGRMSFGSLTAVVQLVGQLQAPFVNLSGIMPQYVAMLASAERLMELETIQGEPDADGARTSFDGWNAIAAEGLCFAYDGEAVLKQADFVLPRGAFAVITGSSGAGKSTLLKLLLGIYHPDGGRLFVQTQDGELLIDRSTRRLFAYVPQGNLLLSGTLRENLTIVRPDASEKEIREAIHASALAEVVDALPDGLDTALGENGAGLSEGQAQRLAIARAVLGAAPVLLMDECTSALDEATEQIVLERLKKLPNRTCIAVTHRPAAIALCDWRLEISDGKISAVQKRESMP